MLYTWCGKVGQAPRSPTCQETKIHPATNHVAGHSLFQIMSKSRHHNRRSHHSLVIVIEMHLNEAPTTKICTDAGCVLRRQRSCPFKVIVKDKGQMAADIGGIFADRPVGTSTLGFPFVVGLPLGGGKNRSGFMCSPLMCMVYYIRHHTEECFELYASASKRMTPSTFSTTAAPTSAPF